jgi:Cdc6-like AAA superfamily ATPase
MSFLESEKDNNKFSNARLLSIKPKLKINRFICNNKNNRYIPNLYNCNNDIDNNDSDSHSFSLIESTKEKSDGGDSKNDELSMNSMNSALYKYLELKCISIVSLSIIKNKNLNNFKTFKKDNDSDSIKAMEISENENTAISYEKEINKNQFLPCRYEEQKEIYNFIKNGLKTNGTYNSLYICGMTGTGKTESVNNVIDIIEAENKENKTIPFRSLFINCVNFDTNMKLIKCIYNFIFSRNVQTNKTSNYLNTLDEFFSERNKYNRNIYLNDPTNSHIILIIDEIDYLINKFQIMLYHIFNWSTYSNSKLIIISISNLINIKDLFLSKISSRFGQNKLMFKPYTKEQIREIINYKGINLNLFDEDALKLTSMKVSAINGDLRRVILILKRALELNNNDVFNNLHGGGNNLVNKNYVLKAYRDLFDSKIIFTLKNLNIYEKIIVGAILLNINKFCNNFIKVECIYNDVNILIEKYNKNNINNGKFELDISWNEFKNIIYNLNRMRIIELRKGDFNNFKDNFILIKFYPDEFSVACEYDDDFKPEEIFLTNSLNQYFLINFISFIKKYK